MQARSQPDIFKGQEKNFGGNYFSIILVIIWFVTSTILLFAFCYCKLKKTRVRLLFIAVKTFNDMPYIHFACNMPVSTKGNNVWNSRLIRFLLIISMACIEKNI